VPTSVLLAVLAAAGLLALAPAMVRRYDATERLVAERALSTARVLACAGTQDHRRRRTVPGRRPVNPPRPPPKPTAQCSSTATATALQSATAPGSASGIASGPSDPSVLGPTGIASVAAGTSGVSRRRGRATGRRPRRLRHSDVVYRRRRVFAALVLFNIVELVGVAMVGPAFWMGSALTGVLLVGYTAHLRNRSLAEQRRVRAEARYADWISHRQAAVRREQARRAAARREALRRQLLDLEEARRQAAQSAVRTAVRGRAYEARALGLGMASGPGRVVNG
jgi:hypothetical protein